MENFTPQILLDIWKKGKTLNEALWPFCDQNYLDEYSKIIPNRTSSQPDSTEAVNFSIQLSNSLKGIYEIQRVSDDLYKNLYQKLKSGTLVAIGYEAPLKATDYPVIIPLHMWPPEKADKYKSSISGNGLNFIAVRIVKNSQLKIKNPKKEINLPKIKPQDKKVGRPSLKNEIIAAYSELKKHGKIGYSDSLKSHSELIQKTVHILFPNIKDTTGMEDEAIRRAVGKIFKVDREKNL